MFCSTSGATSNKVSDFQALRELILLEELRVVFLIACGLPQ